MKVGVKLLIVLVIIALIFTITPVIYHGIKRQMFVRAKESGRPNIILIMTDQQRYDQLGFMSDGYFETPNLDMLAEEGIIFENAYCSAPVCIASRGSLLTGLRPGRYPTAGIGNAVREGFWTVGHALRAAGYQTAIIGKMHLHPIRANHGFDYMRMAEHLGIVYGPEVFDDYTNWLVSQGKGDWRATHIFGFEEWAEKREYSNNHSAVPFYYDQYYHPTNWIAREAVKYLDNRNKNKPYFMIVSFPHPHSPYDPPAPYDTMYDFDDAILPQDGFEVNDDLPPAAKELMMGKNGFGYLTVKALGEEKQRRISTYIRALIKQIDDAIGEILKDVDLENTVVFFTTDHGDYYGHRGLMFKTPGIPFDDLAKVPLFVSGYGIPSGKRVRNNVQNADIALTILELAGVRRPGNVFDTESLVRYFYGDAEDERTVFCWSNSDWPMLRYKNFKYFYNPPTGQEMLFDVDRDPGERVNLIDDPGHRGVLNDFRAGMKRELNKGIANLPSFKVK